MDRDPAGGSNPPDDRSSRLTQRSAAQFGAALGLLLVLFSGCGRPQNAPLEASPVPTAVINSLDELEAAIARAATSFERVGSVDASPAWTGQRYLVNGQMVIALQTNQALDEDQLSGALSQFAAGLDQPVQYWRRQGLAVYYPGSDGGITLVLSGLLGDPLTFQTPVQDEPYPPAVLAVIQYVSQVRGVSPTEIRVISFEEITWPDSCLGLAVADEVCAESAVDGWLVAVEAAGQTIQAHTDEFGQEVRAEQ